MSRNVSTSNLNPQTSNISSKSFTRFEPSKTSPIPGRSRAGTLQTESFTSTHTELTISSPASPGRQGPGRLEDVFEKRDSTEVLSPVSDLSGTVSQSQTLPDRFDELPIELISLTDRFVANCYLTGNY